VYDSRDMLRLGLKLTHDGGLALLDGDRLLCSHEAEKSANLHRHATLDAIDVAATLAQYGVSLADVDRVVVDGWMHGKAALSGGDGVAGGGDFEVPVAHYHEKPEHQDGLAAVRHEGLPLSGQTFAYASYLHSTGHALGTYATSPWARAAEPALILCWDGGMLPRLYEFRPETRSLRLVRRLFGFIGNIYPVFGSYYGPFVPGGPPPTHDSLPDQALLDLSGKVMAWVGLGQVDEELFTLFDAVYSETLSLRWEFLFEFTRAVHSRLPAGVAEPDVVASFQAWLGGRLVDGLRKAFEREPGLPPRLCFTGGSALNIAWNARLRASGLFEDVWVPPFPNDAGSALGAAAADLVCTGESTWIDWDVYRGPALTGSRPAPGWNAAPCDVAALAGFLHATGEPVVFLHGRAELGPRALGNRSILASAALPSNKERLNELKQREWYRPVAPICLESHAPTVFEPGSPDPYMLFTHTVRPEWRERVPAIVHLDGTARLQTIRADQNPLVVSLLEEYRRVSGIPLLCNTSANLKGSGFFPDLRSATEWAPARHVWCDSTLYSRSAVAHDTRAPAPAAAHPITA
jgi:carbamoyltransferase